MITVMMRVFFAWNNLLLWCVRPRQTIALLRFDRVEVRGPGRNAPRKRKRPVSVESAHAELHLLPARA